MNTTLKGDVLEAHIYNLFNALILKGQFWGDDESCRVFRKKGYYSKDREKHIIFDVSVEFYLPGAAQYSMVMLIECKNYAHSVPVDDVEEFFVKVQQVAASNSKAVMATTAAFQKSSMTFAKSKGIGLLRYFDASNFKWELHRSPSAVAFTSKDKSDDSISEGLTSSEFTSTVFDFFLQSSAGLTNSLWDFFEGILSNSGLTPGQLGAMRNPRGRPSRLVPFVDLNDLEEQTISLLRDLGHVDGQVSLDRICARESARCGLVVTKNAPRDNATRRKDALGQISFTPLEIRIYDQVVPNLGRERFTLAHELAHHLLSHADYMKGEKCDDEDFSLSLSPCAVGQPDIVRLEYQANYFASCLLMPKVGFLDDFRKIAHWLGISNRGFGALYLDHQICNYQNYANVTCELMARYGVSRAAATIRLEGLGLLCDVRMKNMPHFG